jgi:hypothetical protein
VEAVSATEAGPEGAAAKGSPSCGAFRKWRRSAGRRRAGRDALDQRQHRERQDALRAREQADRDRAVREQLAALAIITHATCDAARGSAS